MARKVVFYLFAPMISIDISDSVTVLLHRALSLPPNSIIVDTGSHPFASIAMDNINQHVKQHVNVEEGEQIDICIIIWTHGSPMTGNFRDQNLRYIFQWTPELFYGYS